MSINEKETGKTATCLFVLKPLGLLELALSVSFQVDFRENALQSKRTVGSKVRGHTEINSFTGVSYEGDE